MVVLGTDDRPDPRPVRASSAKSGPVGVARARSGKGTTMAETLVHDPATGELLARLTCSDDYVRHVMALARLLPAGT